MPAKFGCQSFSGKKVTWEGGPNDPFPGSIYYNNIK